MSEIINLKISDQEIINLINFYDEDERDIIALKALKIGLIALKDMKTASNVDYVEKEFNKLKSNIDKTISKLDEDLENRFEEAEKIIHDKLNKNFDPETGIMPIILEKYLGEGGKLCDLFDENNNRSAVSKINKIIAEYFDDDASKIAKLLDSNNENSPLFGFKKELIGKLAGIHDEIKAIEAAKQATKKVVQKSTQKGVAYEALLGPEIEEIASILGDICLPTGGEVGQLPNCKTGDFVVTLNSRDTGGASAKIVFEAKDKIISQKEILIELNEAMNNRDAKIAIGVLSGKEIIKDVNANIGNFRDYPPNKLICVYDKEEFDRSALEVAYKLARSKLLFTIHSKEMKSDAVNIAEANRLIDEITKKLNDFSLIKSSLTKANGSISEAQLRVDNLKAELNQLSDVLTEVLTPVASK